MQKILHEQGGFLQKECWNIEMAQNHILQCINRELGSYLTSHNVKTSGKVVMDSVNQAKLCGLSVRAIENVFQEIGKAAGINNEIQVMSDLDIGRLLQV